MAQHIELNPVSHITIGTVGPPGQRVFYFQGSKGSDIISLIIEKQQASMLASSVKTILEELDEESSRDEDRDAIWTDMRLRDPIEPLFRVGNIGIGYDEENKRVAIVAYELVDEEEEPNVVSFWATRDQVRTLAEHAMDVVQAGRPICGNCGNPIDVGGHFCPNRNGHAH